MPAGPSARFLTERQRPAPFETNEERRAIVAAVAVRCRLQSRAYYPPRAEAAHLTWSRREASARRTMVVRSVVGAHVGPRPPRNHSECLRAMLLHLHSPEPSSEDWRASSWHSVGALAPDCSAWPACLHDELEFAASSCGWSLRRRPAVTARAAPRRLPAPRPPRSAECSSTTRTCNARSGGAGDAEGPAKQELWGRETSFHVEDAGPGAHRSPRRGIRSICLIRYRSDPG